MIKTVHIGATEVQLNITETVRRIDMGELVIVRHHGRELLAMVSPWFVQTYLDPAPTSCMSVSLVRPRFGNFVREAGKRCRRVALIFRKSAIAVVTSVTEVRHLLDREECRPPRQLEEADDDPRLEEPLHRDEVNWLLRNIPHRQAQVLRWHYGLGDEPVALTLVEIGRLLGLTHEAVRQIESTALDALRRVAEVSRRPVGLRPGV